jgi:hypothetical protein
MGNIQKTLVFAALHAKALLAFPPFEKGGQGGFALDLPARKAKQIPLDPPFSKGGKS